LLSLEKRGEAFINESFQRGAVLGGVCFGLPVQCVWDVDLGYHDDTIKAQPDSPVKHLYVGA
jgi:hypothetical protein